MPDDLTVLFDDKADSRVLRARSTSFDVVYDLAHERGYRICTVEEGYDSAGCLVLYLPESDIDNRQYIGFIKRSHGSPGKWEVELKRTGCPVGLR